MDSLIIQDGFEPYYAGRRPFRVAFRVTRRAEVRASVGDTQAVPDGESAMAPASAKSDAKADRNRQ